MSNFTVDLKNCDTEPIHIPGLVQSHGFLLVLNSDNIVCYCSDNARVFLPAITSNILGLSLTALEGFLGFTYQPAFLSKLIAAGKDTGHFERTNPVPITIAGKSYYLIISKSADLFLLEFEPALSNFTLDVQNVMGASIAGILSYTTLRELLDNAAVQVKEVIQFDRVMIYRFADDDHGEVVSEAKNKDLEPWLRLHYPASDIPKQARELYKLNLTRLIADVNDVPSGIKTTKGNTASLDLTYSQLRAVSPIHIQYLINMGVASSFSISIKIKDRLWGLIACHNYSPRFIDYRSREYAKLIGQILASALEYRETEEAMQLKFDLKTCLEKLVKQLLECESLEKALTGCATTFVHIVKATGAVLYHNKKIYKLGVTPTDEQLIEIGAWIRAEVKEPVFYTESFSEVFADAMPYKEIASGILISVLNNDLGDYLVWFRPEKIQNIKWAGNPDKPLSINADGLLNISPRNSFEAWSETISGKSESWSIDDIKAVINLKEEINYGINHKAGAAKAMNERLRLAYEELESFSYTISHDLKNPIASIKSYAQLLIKDQMVLERGQKMLQRIADRADQMNLMINSVLDYSRLGRTAMLSHPINVNVLVADIIKDLELIYNLANLKITVGQLPGMTGDPIMMLQVFSNLIGNAVKYSQYSDPAIIHIDGAVIDEKVYYSISDNGIGVDKTNLSKIFELFNRMDNVRDIEGSGVGLAIVKKIIEKHNGQIIAESELNKGSVFKMVFNG